MKTISILSILLISVISCSGDKNFNEDFNSINNRVWVSESLWSVPIEDWKVENGRVISLGTKTNMRLNFIEHTISGEGSFKVSFDFGLLDNTENAGIAGVEIGLTDNTDNSIKSLVYFGKGIKIGVDPEGFFFVGNKTEELPEGFDLSSMKLSIAVSNDDGSRIVAGLSGNHNKQVSILYDSESSIKGSVAIFNDISRNDSEKTGNYWFDNVRLGGHIIEINEDDKFGPVLWTMYTLSKNTLKLMAQMPPLSSNDNMTLFLEIRNNDTWERIATSEIDPLSYTSVFKVSEWDAEKEFHYRVAYDMRSTKGSVKTSYYDGIIRSEPENGPLVMGALTCQYNYGFPYSPLVHNLEQHNPDILFFSGDQLYEGNGGYGIERFPAERAILNYLGKWYMFGWAFGDLLRDRPSISIPDDHEVFQGNLWGDNGKSVDINSWGMDRDCLSGFVEPADMVKVVMLTNCSHLPDPYDPTPMEQDIPVYYTDLLYGGVSFAIAGDRVFKSGPELVATWDGRKDHIVDPAIDTRSLENSDLKLLGDRQIKFLEEWSGDWKNASLKVFLSQTLLTNAATHHGGEKMFLLGDLDSGGWPKTGRDKALKILRNANAFHICGDQHLPSLIQYGIEDFRDAVWAYCTPAITVGYERRFLPDSLGWKISERPDHGFANTGNYTDVFGNKNYIYAVGNPEHITADKNRYVRAQKTSSGFGIVRFDTEQRLITSEAYRFMATFGKYGENDIFPGWPLTINPFEEGNTK